MRRTRLVATAALLATLALSGRLEAASNSTSPTISALEKAMAGAGCTLRDAKPLPPPSSARTNFHAAKSKWNTFPPAAGAHTPAWATWGFHREPVDPRRVVHNLEHGGIVIWWGPDAAPCRRSTSWEAFYEQSRIGMFGTLIDGLGNKVALSAWTGNPSTYFATASTASGTSRCARDSTRRRSPRSATRTAARGPRAFRFSRTKPGM